jgi:cytochrome P450 family 6
LEIFAGFETSSAMQAFALYELSKNPEIQERIRNEIKEALKKTGGKVTYDSVMNVAELPYLNQVFHETLRLYPIVPMLDRICNDPKGYSLEPICDFKVPYGMPIYIPYFTMQRDEKYFPDPLKFDPERFAPGSNLVQPYTNFPFGSGPRNCIGERFGIMQVKTGIVKILLDFRLEMTENTPREVVMEEKSMVVQSKKGLFLNLVKDPLF